MSKMHVHRATVLHDGLLNLEGLPLRAGDQVEIFIVRQSGNGGSDGGSGVRYPLRGQPLRYDRPFDPAVDPQEWEANR